MKLRRLLVIMFALCLAVGVMTLGASAAVVASGECGADGDNVTWTLDDEGTLTVSGEGSMGQTGWSEYNTQIKSVIISDGVTNIYEYAFADCSNLSSVSFGEDIESIDFFAFFNCSGLTEIELGDSVEEIGPAAFARCSGLTDVKLGNGVESIGGDAFYQCNSLTSIELGSSVELIDDYAFSYCAVLQEIVFTGDAPNFGEAVFAGLEAAVYYPAGNKTWSSSVMQDYDGDITWTAYTPLEITTQPKTVYAKQGATVKTTVKATGDGLTYTWYIKNAGGSSYSKSSVTSATYSCTMNSKSKDRLLYCVVKDKYGNSVKSNTVRLRMAATITKQPTHASAAVGSVAKTTVTAVGDGLTYTWYLKNPGAAKFSKSSVTSATYSVKMSESNNGRQVYCVVKDKYGKTAQSNTVTLGLPVEITTQPKTTYTKQGVVAKTTVKADGDGLTYTWYVKNSGAAKYSKSSITSATYSVKMSSTSKDRLVYCVIKDKYGNSVKSNTVLLRMAATITTQPKSVTVAKGSTAKVSLTAVGDGLTYTWYYKNAGATKFTKTTAFTGNTYSVAMNAARDGRQIYCVVTDKYGKTAKSNTVTLNMK